MQILLGLRSFDSWASIAVWCRYANLRRRLLIDPHLSKDEEGAPELIVQNPLPQIRRQTLVLDHCLPDLSLYHTTCLILEPICPNLKNLTVHPRCPLFLSDLIYFEFSQSLANVDHTGSLMYFLVLPPSSQAVQPPFKTREGNWAGKCHFHYVLMPSAYIHLHKIHVDNTNKCQTLVQMSRDRAN